MSNLSMGRTSFVCRSCQTVHVIENRVLESMTGYRCQKCGTPMSEARFAKLKIQYYAMLYKALTTPPFGGEGPEMFRVDMDLSPHFE